MKALLTFCASALLSLSAYAAIEVGAPAPDFKLIDTMGTEHSLSDFKDKTVILEWTNHECPFVVKHYESGNMQELQKTYTDKDVVWLSVISSAPGKQGYVSPEEGQQISKNVGSEATAKLLDPSGDVGRAYGARTTPHMYIIEKGELVYMGAIDDKPSTRVSDIEGATNYVTAAMTDLLAGNPVQKSSTRPYGCSVKY